MFSDAKKNPLNINLNHSNTKIDDAIGFFPGIWHVVKKYSVNNTLPIAAVSTWLQFSLAYIAAVIITHNNLSYITDIFNSQLMPAYALASVILGAILLTSLIIKLIYKQEIKDEILKNGENTIDEKIRGGYSDGINEIAQNASTIEIIPDTSLIGNKKENFSIVLPISEKQGETLENKRQENRNKIILLTVPYVLSGLIVAGALANFGFVHVRGWKERTFIAAVGIITIVGICITLSKNNEVNNTCNTVKKFNNLDILLPCRKGTIVSVMEKKTKDEEENDPISRLIKLLDKHLTDFTDKMSDSFDKFLGKAKTSIDEKFLEPANANVKDTLDGIRGDLETLLANLEKIIGEDIDEVKKNANKEITKCLKDISKSIGESLKEIHTELKDKLNQLQPSGIGSYLVKLVPTASNRQAGDSHGQNHSLESTEEEEFFDCSALTKENKKEIIQEVRKVINDVVQSKLEPIQKQLETLQASGNPDSDLGSENIDQFPLTLEDTVKARRKTVRNLELKEENNRLIEKEQKLTQKKPEQEKTDEWKEKINGKPSEFLYYLLESIKLEEKDNKEKKVEVTLRNFDNKIIIHWKDSSKTTCRIEKQGDPPSTKVDFVDKNIHAAFKVACVG